MRPRYSIAMVAACPFPANHGTPAAIREMSEELARRGHTVRVVTYPLGDPVPTPGVAIDRVCQVGFNRAISVGPSYQRLVFDCLLVFKLWQVVQTHHIDIIHAHNYEAALVAGLIARWSGLPLVYNAINTMAGELPSYRFIWPPSLARRTAQFLDYVTPRLADAVIADTAELQKFLTESGVPADRITTINSGVRPEMFTAGNGSRVRQHFDFGNAPLIVYTGTFDEFQGLNYLLPAFKLVRQHHRDVRLMLAGSTTSPTHRSKYAAMAADLEIDSAVTITTCDLVELPDFLAAADIAVVPRPESSGIPTKLLNYMAAGKPIVSFEKSATILVDGESGRLVTIPSAEALAEGILDLLANRGRAAELGRNARRAASASFNWSGIAEKIEAVYEKVLVSYWSNCHAVAERRISC